MYHYLLYDCRPLLRSHYLNLVIIFFCYTYFVTILEPYVSRPELYFSTGLSKHEKLFKVKIKNKLRKFSKKFFRILSSWWQNYRPHNVQSRRHFMWTSTLRRDRFGLAYSHCLELHSIFNLTLVCVFIWLIQATVQLQAV